MTAITHVALFASATAVQSIQSVGTSADEAIANAARETGVPASDLVAKAVTDRMGALLAMETPTGWIEVDGVVDTEVDYAVFSDLSTVFDDETGEQAHRYVNLHGEDIEADGFDYAAIFALDDCGLERVGDYTVVSYPRTLSFGEVFEECGGTKFRLRPGIDPALVSLKSIELVDEEADAA